MLFSLQHHKLSSLQDDYCGYQVINIIFKCETNSQVFSEANALIPAKLFILLLFFHHHHLLLSSGELLFRMKLHRKETASKNCLEKHSFALFYLFKRKEIFLSHFFCIKNSGFIYFNLPDLLVYIFYACLPIQCNCENYNLWV